MKSRKVGSIPTTQQIPIRTDLGREVRRALIDQPPVRPVESMDGEAEACAEGEKYAAECGQAFIAAHQEELGQLVTTYADAEAEELLFRLRELFWTRTWKK